MTTLRDKHAFFCFSKNAGTWLKLLLILCIIFGIAQYMRLINKFQWLMEKGEEAGWKLGSMVRENSQITGEEETTVNRLLQQVIQEKDHDIQLMMGKGENSQSTGEEGSTVNHLLQQVIQKKDQNIQLMTGKGEEARWQLDSLIRKNSQRTGIRGSVHLSRTLLNTPQQNEIFNLLNKKKKGVFLEIGAFDGERASNTLVLELEHQWTGILIEPNPFLYMQVLGKNRNVWAVHGCLSTTDAPTVLSIELACRNRRHHICGGSAKMSNVSTNAQHIEDNFNTVCFPLAAILRTLNITTVDYFSLDIEGAEFDVLKGIPFAELDIKTLSVEYKHNKVGKDVMINYMKSQGYEFHKELKSADEKNLIWVEDLIFVKSSN